MTDLSDKIEGRIEKKELLLNQIKQSKKKEKEDTDSLSDPFQLKAKPQKLFTPVKIETGIVKKFKQIVYENDLESHGVIMNAVLRNWADEILANS